MPFNPIYDEQDLAFVRQALESALKGQVAALGREGEIGMTSESEDLPGDIKRIKVSAEVPPIAVLSNPGLCRVAMHLVNRGLMSEMIDSLPFERIHGRLAEIAENPPEAAEGAEDPLIDGSFFDPVFDAVVLACRDAAEETGIIDGWEERFLGIMTEGLPVKYGIYAEATLSPWAPKDEEMTLSQGFSISAPWFLDGESPEAGLKSQGKWLAWKISEKSSGQ